MSAVVSAIIAFFNRLIQAFQDLVLWFQDFLLYIPKWVYSNFVDAVVSLVTWVHGVLPDPSAAFNMSGLPSGVGYFLPAFHLELGIPLIATAYALRFFIRRLPFVG